MTPRTRTVSDNDVLVATSRVMSKVGVAALTLSQVSEEVGLAPATLLQRFGSKRGLLLAVSAASVGGVEAELAEIRADFDSPVAALIASASAVAQSTGTAGEAANHLTFLQVDRGDPEFHRHALETARRTRDWYRTLIREAIADGELVECDADVLARAVEAISRGALATWTIHREGDAATYVRRDLGTLLRGYGRGVWARSGSTAPI
jgi:AcrR family transcriptional regulator